MFKPAIAPVRPHVASPVTGDSVLLEDEVLGFVEQAQTGIIVLLGDRGSGKTTALQHLAAVLPQGSRVSLIDDGDAGYLPHVPKGGITVCARRLLPSWPLIAQLRLQPWNRDEWIEYLLSVDPSACLHVLPRTGDHTIVGGSPRLWRIVLDTLAADPSLPNVRAAIDKHLSGLLATSELRHCAADFCLLSMYDPEEANLALLAVRDAGLPREAEPILLHRSIRVLLGAEAVVTDLQSLKAPAVLHRRIPRDVAEAAGHSLSDQPGVRTGLERFLSSKRDENKQAMAASLLRFSDPGWRPTSLAKEVNLQAAYLDDVDWPGVRLRKANLIDVDFTNATLTQADLSESALQRAVFCGASLSQSNLSDAKGDDANFTQADLTRATLNGAELDGADFVDAHLDGARMAGTSLVAVDFTRARLVGANLTRANLYLSKLDDADLTDANFERAELANVDLRSCVVEQTSFRGARLADAHLENVDWPDAQLAEADLLRAHLTGSILRGADLRKAKLCHAYLSEIDWEGADLRKADLRGASFHMGSTREGLLTSPYASEGTRTGFYTDEYADQHFKPPEEIRKANLRGCDLRGADIAGVDFYLVDLRGALLDSHQLAYLESCGAILTE